MVRKYCARTHTHTHTHTHTAVVSCALYALSVGVGNEGIAKLQSAKQLLENELFELQFADVSVAPGTLEEEESLHSILSLLQGELESEQERISRFATQASQRQDLIADVDHARRCINPSSSHDSGFLIDKLSECVDGRG